MRQESPACVGKVHAGRRGAHAVCCTALIPTLYLWKKSVPVGRADFWTERLGAFVPPERLVVVSPVAGRSVRLEVYCDAESGAAELARKYGGQVRMIRAESWQPPPATAPGRPLAIGGALWVTGREEELPALRAAHPGKPVLCIPAAMAFGTGEHATTAMCLRLLAGAARTLSAPSGGASWEILDLGAGSGILALAGKLFGAGDVLGLENDPHAVRTARENAALNAVRGVGLRPAALVKEWPPARRGQWQIITANLFSELLTSLLPRIRLAMADQGFLIASGILVSQAPELELAFTKNRLEVVDRKRRGKWTAFLVRKAGPRRRRSSE